jgi:hypothetical protein
MSDGDVRSVVQAVNAFPAPRAASPA